MIWILCIYSFSSTRLYSSLCFSNRVSVLFLYMMFYLNIPVWNSLSFSFLFFRLLALATCFATKMIRKYWLLEHRKRKDAYKSGRIQLLSLPPVSPVKIEDEMANSRRLREMAHFLEIIRNLQSRLGSKYKRPGQELVRFAVL